MRANIIFFLATSDKINPFYIFLIFVIGLWNIISPHSSWYLTHGWRYENAEPSEAAIILTRFSGLFAIIIGFVLIFYNL